MKLFGRSFKKEEKKDPTSPGTTRRKLISPRRKKSPVKARQTTPTQQLPTVSLAGRNPVGRYLIMHQNGRLFHVFLIFFASFRPSDTSVSSSSNVKRHSSPSHLLHTSLVVSDFDKGDPYGDKARAAQASANQRKNGNGNNDSANRSAPTNRTNPLAGRNPKGEFVFA